MDGMMSGQDMAALQNAQGVNASRLYLTQMIDPPSGRDHDGAEGDWFRSVPCDDCAGAIDRRESAEGDRDPEGHSGVGIAGGRGLSGATRAAWLWRYTWCTPLGRPERNQSRCSTAAMSSVAITETTAAPRGRFTPRVKPTAITPIRFTATAT
jgi:hypothetical protein